MKRINCAVLQFNISLGYIDGNLDKVLVGLRRVAEHGAQLVVLPEMWSCGYDYRNLKVLATETPRILKILLEESHKLSLVIVGSMPELDNDGHIYNSAYVIDNGELRGTYRKLHLFSAMREDQFFSPGNTTLVTKTSVGCLGIVICYDLRFPELFRKMALAGAEIICLPAEWPKPRQDHWQILLRARAIENQLFIVAANCCGKQGKLDFPGLSQCISPRGTILDIAGEKNTELVTELDFNELLDYRNKIDILNDRRNDIYGTP
jgi:predicted amidohydrolase